MTKQERKDYRLTLAHLKLTNSTLGLVLEDGQPTLLALHLVDELANLAQQLRAAHAAHGDALAGK